MQYRRNFTIQVKRDQISRSIRALEFAGSNHGPLTGYTDCGS